MCILLQSTFLFLLCVSHAKEAENPYFFLTPIAPVSFDFPIYEKNAKINQLFWIVPNKTIKNGYTLSLTITVPKNLGWPDALNKTFSTSRPLHPQKQPDTMHLKLFKIDAQNNPVLIFDKKLGLLFRTRGWSDENYIYADIYLESIASPTQYGQYNLIAEVLADNSNLKIENIRYSITIKETPYRK